MAEKEIRYGHMKMRIWQNIDELDCLTQNLLQNVPHHEFKLRSQIDSASDSVGANFVEGYYSGSLAEYMRFLRYGKRSLAELQERTRRAVRKQYLSHDSFNRFNDLAIRTMYLFDRLIQALQYKAHREQPRPKAKESKTAAIIAFFLFCPLCLLLPSYAFLSLL